MRYYCPNCWKDFWDDDFVICPECGFNIDEYDSRDYVDKLISTLGHRAGEIRHYAIMILVQRKEKRALPYLEQLKNTTEDPLLARAAAEAIHRIKEDIVKER